MVDLKLMVTFQVLNSHFCSCLFLGSTWRNLLDYIFRAHSEIAKDNAANVSGIMVSTSISAMTAGTPVAVWATSRV